MTEKILKNLKIAQRLLGITILLFIAAFFIMNSPYLSIDNLSRIVSDVKTAAKGSPLSDIADITQTEQNKSAGFKSGFCTVSQNILSIYSSNMNKYSEHTVNMKNPVLKTSKKYVLAFDRGGQNVYICDSFKVLHTFTFSEQPLINAGLDDKGNIYVITEKYGYKASLTLYDSAFNEIFVWNCADSYVLDAFFTQDNTITAVCINQNKTNANTILQKLNFIQGKTEKAITVENAYPISYVKKDNSTIQLMTENGIISIKDEEKKVVYTFDTNLPVDFIQTPSYLLFTTNSDKIILIDNAGNVRFEKSYKNIQSICTNRTSFYLLSEGIIYELNSSGEELAKYTPKEGGGKIIANDDRCFIVNADYVEKINF